LIRPQRSYFFVRQLHNNKIHNVPNTKTRSYPTKFKNPPKVVKRRKYTCAGAPLPFLKSTSRRKEFLDDHFCEKKEKK